MHCMQLFCHVLNIFTYTLQIKIVILGLAITISFHFVKMLQNLNISHHSEAEYDKISANEIDVNGNELTTWICVLDYEPYLKVLKLSFICVWTCENTWKWQFQREKKIKYVSGKVTLHSFQGLQKERGC